MLQETGPSVQNCKGGVFLVCKKKKKKKKLGFTIPKTLFMVLPWQCTSSVFSVLLLKAVTKDIPVNLFLTVHVKFLHVPALHCCESLGKVLFFFSVFY